MSIEKMVRMILHVEAESGDVVAAETDRAPPLSGNDFVPRVEEVFALQLPARVVRPDGKKKEPK